MNVDVCKDLSCLTNIDSEILAKIFGYISNVIAHNVVEAKKLGDEAISFNFESFIVNVKLEENSIKYGIVPSNKLTSKVQTAIKTNVSPILTTLNKSISSALLNSYKEFF